MSGTGPLPARGYATERAGSQRALWAAAWCNLDRVPVLAVTLLRVPVLDAA